MNIKTRKGQSIVEYAILLGVVIAALLIMQVFVKRGFQGGLKDSADKMGEQFSAGRTTIYQSRALDTSIASGGNQTITEEVGTTAQVKKVTVNTDGTAATSTVDGGIAKYKTGLYNTVDKGAYSYNERSGGTQTVKSATTTESAKNEDFTWGDHNKTTGGVDNYPSPLSG